jgi:uncharacterized protein YdeI (YjbR/CyaY-like superfamily)
LGRSDPWQAAIVRKVGSAGRTDVPPGPSDAPDKLAAPDFPNVPVSCASDCRWSCFGSKRLAAPACPQQVRAMPMITDIEDFFTRGCGRCDRFDTPDCSTKRWTAGLNRLREICRATGLTEEVKWAHPCYTLDGRNIAIIGAFRDDFRLTFFDAALLKDPEGILERQGPNTQNPDCIRFTSNQDPAKQEATIRAYLDESIGYAKAGLKPEKVQREIDMPDELIEALDGDPELAEAFAALTPGRQKSYAFALNQAKQSATRIRRIETLRPKILAGKGAQEY